VAPRRRIRKGLLGGCARTALQSISGDAVGPGWNGQPRQLKAWSTLSTFWSIGSTRSFAAPARLKAHRRPHCEVGQGLDGRWIPCLEVIEADPGAGCGERRASGCRSTSNNGNARPSGAERDCRLRGTQPAWSRTAGARKAANGQEGRLRHSARRTASRCSSRCGRAQRSTEEALCTPRRTCLVLV